MSEIVSGTLRRLLLVGAALQLAGCSSKVPPGITEFKGITTKGLNAVNLLLSDLDKVNAEGEHCSPKTVAAFSSNVQKLQVDSIQVRARGRAILARGDEYFADWPQSASRVKDPQVRELAERYHLQLQESFSKIKAASKEGGAAFDSFLSGLRQLRVDLETKPNGSTNRLNLIASSRDNGQKVAQHFSAVIAELQTATSLLTPGKSSTSQ